MKFDCKHCNAMCCVTPPVMTSTDEIKKAIGLGALVIAYPVTDNDFVVMVAKDTKTMMCPFLDGSGCSIYEDRFDVCKEFSCTAKEYEIVDLSNLDADTILLYQTTSKGGKNSKQEATISTSLEELKTLGVVVLRNVHIVTQMTVAFDMDTAMDMATKQRKKLYELNM